MKKRVLFICVHNSARSQMAEEILRKLADDRFETESAGLEPGKLNPLVIAVLQEIGIDITHKKTQAVADVLRRKIVYDYVITVCDEASAERCPFFPGKGQRLHWGFPDPAQFSGSCIERTAKTRQVRDEIYQRLEQWLAGS